MRLRIAAAFFFLVSYNTYGQWAGCSDSLTAFSKVREGKGAARWNASGWKEERFPQADFPRVSESRFYGYGSYGRYYKARTSYRRGFWIKDFRTDTRDVLRRTGHPVDLPTPEQLEQMALGVARSEASVLKFLGATAAMPYGLRSVRTRGLVTPATLQYAEPLRGRTLSSILNDASIDLEYRQLLWKQFLDSLELLKSNFASKTDVVVDTEEIDGFGMKFYTTEHTFSVTICGTLFDPQTEEFVIVDPFYFD